MSELSASMVEFLNGRHYATLATHEADGSVYLTPVWYLYEDGKFYVETDPRSRKASNVSARPRVSIVVDSRRRQGDETWVSAKGSAELLPENREIHAKILKRYLTKEGLEHESIGPGFMEAGAVIIEITPDTLKSWEFKDLDDQFFGGILRKSPEKWFHAVD